MNNGSRSAAKEVFWRERLENQAGSGLSVRAFCRREGLSEPSFYSWRRELEKRDRRRAADPAAVTARSAAGSARLVAVDVTGVLGGATLEIAVAGGVVIRLREDVSTETFERLLNVICRQQVAMATIENRLECEAASCCRHGRSGRGHSV